MSAAFSAVLRESAAFAMITVVGAGLSFHPTGPLDAGIDGFIELRDPQTGEVRAQYVMAQLKTKDDGTFNQESASSFLWSVDHRDLEYWLGSTGLSIPT